MPLFRTESMRSQDRLHGDVNLAPPTAWQAIGLGMVALTAVAIAFLSLAHYSRIATARGIIESDRGVVHVTVSAGGVIDRVLVVEGQRVAKGQTLAVVRHATTTDGGSLEERRAQAVTQEGRALDEKGPALRQASVARIAALESEIGSARTDQAEIASQMLEQRDLITAAERDLAKAREIAVRGFVSQHDIRLREETLANRRQGLSRLMQARASAASSESAARQRIGQEHAEMATAMSEIEGQRATLLGRSAADGSAPTTTVVASIAGLVSGSAVAGQSLSQGEAMLDIVPTGGRMRVRLDVPAEAVAMIATGQSARVSVDAFPYQTYGTVPARIVQVSTAAVRRGDGTGFVALADLGAVTVSAYGRSRPIRPGMQVTARIKTMDRTLAQWLLDPLYAVARR